MTLLYCASSNAGKLREFRAAGEKFAAQGFRIEPLPGLESLAPWPETGSTFAENATGKAIYYSAFTDQWVFAEDSGLVVEALNGEPGVQSARFAGPGASDENNNRLLLEKLRGVADRRARFVCVIALARQKKPAGVFEGAVEGEILDAERGEGGFGYDPLFYYPPLRAAFAELPLEKKIEVSHRAQALRRMLEALTAGIAI